MKNFDNKTPTRNIFNYGVLNLSKTKYPVVAPDGATIRKYAGDNCVNIKFRVKSPAKVEDRHLSRSLVNKRQKTSIWTILNYIEGKHPARDGRDTQ